MGSGSAGCGGEGNLCFGVPDPLFPLAQPLPPHGITPEPGLLVINRV
jgi:hypothetical protein